MRGDDSGLPLRAPGRLSGRPAPRETTGGWESLVRVMIDTPPAASGNGAVHTGTGTGTGTGAYVPIGRAAALLGLSGDVLRKRAASGSVRARKVDNRWWVWVDGATPTVEVSQPEGPATPPVPVPEPDALAPEPEPATRPPEAADPPGAPAPPGREEWRQLLGLVEKLQEENRNLAGQLGFVQAQRQALEERVKLLEAPPPEPEPEPVDVPPEPEPESLEGASRPWWGRALAWLRG